MARGAPKGHPRYGGRAKGTLNKKSQTIQQFLDDRGIFIPEKIMQLCALVPEPKDQARIWLELMPYIYPKRSSNDTTLKLTPNDLVTQAKELLNQHRSHE